MYHNEPIQLLKFQILFARLLGVDDRCTAALGKGSWACDEKGSSEVFVFIFFVKVFIFYVKYSIFPQRHKDTNEAFSWGWKGESCIYYFVFSIIVCYCIGLYKITERISWLASRKKFIKEYNVYVKRKLSDLIILWSFFVIILNKKFYEHYYQSYSF